MDFVRNATCYFFVVAAASAGGAVAIAIASLSHLSFEIFVDTIAFFTWLSLFSWTPSSATKSNLKKIPLRYE